MAMTMNKNHTIDAYHSSQENVASQIQNSVDNLQNAKIDTVVKKEERPEDHRNLSIPGEELHGSAHTTVAIVEPAGEDLVRAGSANRDAIKEQAKTVWPEERSIKEKMLDKVDSAKESLKEGLRNMTGKDEKK
mmetsp:Transcript_55530/g.136076  ORF Transcript_55530/g.136076 Transcript_55530/m.136076 type:complete len:133 (+) Transcript_55530:67-465(+)